MAELSGGTKRVLAIVLLLLSTLVVLTNEVLYHLSRLADADPGVIHGVASVVGWVVLVSSVVYLLASLRTQLPIIDFRE
ncbi:hypothetical protein DVR14_15410 [Natrinema thermotolerans]|nr:hypothetical protein DVR14_15410 [Natrinema thermotolerans]